MKERRLRFGRSGWGENGREGRAKAVSPPAGVLPPRSKRVEGCVLADCPERRSGGPFAGRRLALC